MESGTDGLLPLGGESGMEPSLEAEDIYRRIEALSSERKARLIHRLISTLTTDELANVLDEIAIKLRNTGSQ